jgi:Flp pilus assembly protein TadG
LFLSLAILLFAVIVDFGRLWVAAGEIQRALDAAALAGANTTTVYVEIDKYGNIYNYLIETDPYEAEADAIGTFDYNTQGFTDTTIASVTVVVDGTKVTVTSEFEVPTFLLRAFAPYPQTIRLKRSASAECTIVPLTP